METKRVAVAINGALGKMGQRLCYLTAVSEDCHLVGAMMYEGHDKVGTPLKDCLNEIPRGNWKSANEILELSVAGDYKELDVKPDVIIDFCSKPEGSVRLAKNAASDGISLVIGTTGLTKEQTAEITGAEVAGKVPVIHAMNYSPGMNLVYGMAAQLATTLGKGYDIEISESHHRRKKDAPSGTALALADSICAATGRTRADLRSGRQGTTGERTEKEIGIHSIRMGGVTGEHTVHFANDVERIELTYKAEDRDAFALGALKAAAWLKGKPAGMHEILEVWGLKGSAT